MSMKDREYGKKLSSAFFLLLFSFALTVGFYILFSIAYGSIWPDEWEKRESYWFVMFFGSLILLTSSYYFVISRELVVDNLINKAIDINEFNCYKPLDAILSHYGNMASVGMLMGLLVFSIKPFSESNSVLLVGPVLAVVFFALTMIYSVILVKPLVYFSKCRLPFAIAIMLVLVLIDLQGLRFFISSVPQ